MVGARTDGAPWSIPPMLATAGALPADDGSWAFEFKWDGLRAICYLERGEARFVSRNGNNLTSGIPSFQALQSRGHSPSAAVAYIIFDVLWLDGSSMMDKPYGERRAVLEDLALDRIASWSVAPSFAGPGSDVVAASGERGLEGVVAKRLDSRYIPGSRSPLWIKLKHVRSQEVVIGGFTKGGGSRSGSIGALLLGVADVSGLRYVGKVGSGFDSEELRSLGTALSKIPAEVSPFSEVLPAPDRRAATWVQPTLVGEVSFSEWTAAGRLRQPVWKGLRGDKSPSDVLVE